MESSFVLLARVGDPNQAMLLRARLDSEGIEARMRGEALGPYRLNVGAMAVTEIWIAPERMEEARLILLAADADAIVAGVDPIGFGPSAHPIRSWVWWLVAAILVAVVGYARVLVFPT
ncbi:MAG: DUF2007 domain-containing protein [Acidimicrobiia bacterium]|nr:DUF2007 domain-containing protein [Acidimicrobiia bacterium]MDH3399234.1 DUF2007 domain-containing protein [Acidimicrobiia bacterium]